MEDKVFNPANITCKVYANWKFVEFYLANTIIRVMTVMKEILKRIVKRFLRVIGKSNG
jgi:hypothetical protein